MAWTAPMTAVANTAFTAAQFNTHVRDNLLETAPAKATAGLNNGTYFVKNGTNSLTDRLPLIQSVLTSQSTSSSSYTNLTTNGPVITATTGARCMIFLSADIVNNSDSSSYVSVAVSGATTISATDDHAIRFREAYTGNGDSSFQGSHVYLFTTLTPGINTFTMKYRTNGGTSTFSNRHIMTLAF